MTTQFYAPPDCFRSRRMILDGDEARHIAKSLRKAPGDTIYVADGTGHRHEVLLNHVRPEQVVGTVQATEVGAGEPPYRLTIGLGLLKNRNRFETFLEKAVECGVHRIIPLLTARTEVESLRENRAKNILIAAMKQSGRSVLPELTAPTPLPDILDAASNSRDGRWICHEAAQAPSLAAAVRASRPFSREEPQGIQDTGTDRPAFLVLVGPEGGFSEDEIDAARDAGIRAVRLGPHRLRAETAGIVAASAVSLAFADADIEPDTAADTKADTEADTENPA
jgi:16S rRNA (uracil1498-N3)-methyltransferase